MSFEEHVAAFQEADRRLQQRQEALAQSLELLASMHVELEKQTTAQFGEVARLFGQTRESIERLVRVAEAHEERLDDLENR